MIKRDEIFVIYGECVLGLDHPFGHELNIIEELHEVLHVNYSLFVCPRLLQERILLK